MGERIELPQTPQGTAEEQMRQMYSYLYRVAEALNHNLSEIGSMDLTDEERIIMQQITAEDEGTAAAAFDWQGKESLKSLIIKTAAFVQNKLDAYRINLLGEYVAEGKFGRYVRNTGLKVDITPSGITQDFTFEEVVQGLQTYKINAKNYIKTGLLRTEQSIPVYGVAIGKDVVTFANDGTETYNDGNKVCELTADELSFYQSGNKVARYSGTELIFYQGGVAKLKIDANGVTILNGATKLAELLGNKISFYNNGTEIMYIEGGKIYATDNLTISAGKDIILGNWSISDEGLEYKDPNDDIGFEIKDIADISSNHSGIYTSYYTSSGFSRSELALGVGIYGNNTFKQGVFYFGTYIDQLGNMNKCLYGGGGANAFPSWLGTDNRPWDKGYINDIIYDTLTQNSSRDVKHGIEDMPEVGEKIDGLRPVTFIYDKDPEERRRTGLIYEEAIDVMPEICTRNESEKGINYVELIPMMIKEIQDLRARVAALEGGRQNVSGD